MKHVPGCDLKLWIESLSLEQKIDLQALQTAITSKAMPEVGVPAMRIADGATGISYLQVYLDRIHEITKQAPQTAILSPGAQEDAEDRTMDVVLRDFDEAYEASRPGSIEYMMAKELVDMKPNGKDPTCFPSGALLGSTWNPSLVHRCGQYLGLEMAMFGVDVVLGPNMDIQRDPLCGRGYECYAEDPFLVGRIGSALIQGMQTEGVAACAKHFAANNQETNRQSVNAVISERALREIYLRGFEAAVKEGGVKSIMMAYNKINGVHCTESARLMKDIIREEWGFEGCIVSDWGAAYDEPVSIRAGLDLILPQRKADIRQAIAEGQLDEKELDRCVYWIMRMYETLNGMTGRANAAQYDDADAVAAVYDCVVDGAVLLKNNDALPLPPGSKTAFWGKRTKKLIDCGGGSTQVFTRKTSDIWTGAQRANGREHCVFERMDDDTRALVYTVAYPGHEHFDNISLFPEHEERAKLPAVLREAKENGIKTVVVLNTAGPVDMREWIEYADAVLCIYLPGCEGGHAVADMLYGIASPGGRLAQTFPIQYRDTPSALNFPGFNGEVNYGEGIYVGYRYYDKKGIVPLYPFGHGLTYTSFCISVPDGKLSFDAGRQDYELLLPVTVKNTGSHAGSEVIQVYVGADRPSIPKPDRELKGFAKVHLKVGEEKTVQIPLRREAFQHYDAEHGDWCVEPGEYTLYVGRSSRDFAARIPVQVVCPNPYGIGAHSTINEIAASRHAVDCMRGIVPDFECRMPEFLRDFDGETLREVYDAIMDDYYVNPIQGAILFEAACKRMNDSQAPVERDG